VLIAAGVVALSFTPWVRQLGTILGWDTPQRPFDLLAAGLVVAHGAPLAIRGRYPVACLALVSAAFAAYQSLGYPPTFASLALYLALFGAGARQRRHRWVTVAVWSLGYALLCALFVSLGSPAPVVEYGYFFAIPAACWLGGSWAHGQLLRHEEQQRHELLRHEEQQRHATESALRDEREHLARELHDVVTHHVTAMIMQADAARFVPEDDRGRVREGLLAVGDTGRRALTDLRQLLNVLSPGGAAPREPAGGRIEGLVEQTRAAGQPVELIMAGEVESAVAYRVVQEALTNALKHAPGRPTVVRAVASGGRVTIEVTTASTVNGTAPGRGLTGLKRRVELAGGELGVEQSADGAFTVRATL
jgi:signal transduction histidine kinase